MTLARSGTGRHISTAIRTRSGMVWLDIEAKSGAIKLGFLDKLKSGLTGGGRGDEASRRASRRIELPIPVRLKLGGGELEPRRVLNMSLHGIALGGPLEGDLGDPAAVQFLGYPKICDPFVLLGSVAREIEDAPGLAIRIDRENTPREALDQYRKLVLHYLRHRPLLEELDSGFFEGRCGNCGWIGRVGARRPRCSKCAGEKIFPVSSGSTSSVRS